MQNIECRIHAFHSAFDILHSAFAPMISLRGKFIVFDGTEGSGKSTQAALLRERLAAIGTAKGGLPTDDILVIRDPGTTRIGEKIRNILLDPENEEMGMRCEMLLYMSCRAQMLREHIVPALQAGKLVLCDRFVSSTLAYQLGGEDLTADEIRKVADVAIRGRWPDLTILLDMPADESMRRVKPKALSMFEDVEDLVDKDRIERRPMSYHEQVRANYLSQAAANPDRYRIVNANRDRQAVHEDVWRIVTGL
jgi:dTMP kinase